MNIFPVDAATTVIDGITGALTDNIGVVLAILGFTVGLAWVFKLVRKSTHGKM